MPRILGQIRFPNQQRAQLRGACKGYLDPIWNTAGRSAGRFAQWPIFLGVEFRASASFQRGLLSTANALIVSSFVVTTPRMILI